MKRAFPSRQSGVMLLEALFAILIFSMGILALVGMQAASIRATTDSKSRADAGYLANRIIGQMWLENRTSDATLQAALTTYVHRPTGGGADCAPTGADSGNANVVAWLNEVASMPGATATMQQIVVDTAANNLVTVRICWRGPQDPTPRNFVAIANIN